MGVAQETLASDVLRAVLDRALLGIGIFEPVDDGRDLRLRYANERFRALKPFRVMQGRLYSEIWPELAEFAIPRFIQVAVTGEPWVERDLPLEVEDESGALVTRYYTYEISRVQSNGHYLVVDMASETTGEVETRKRLQDLLGEQTSLADQLQKSLTERARLADDEHEMQRQLRQELETTKLLLDAAYTLTASNDLDTVLRALADIEKGVTHRKRVSVSLYDAERDELITTELAVGEAFPPGTRVAVEALAPMARAALATRRPQVVDYDSPGVPPLSRQRAASIGYRYILVVPLMLGDRLLGFMNVDDPGEKREFTQRSIDISMSIASQAAVAIENARLFEVQREAARYSQALNEVNETVSSTLDVAKIMNTVVGVAAAAVDATVAAIYMPVDGEWEARFTWQAPAWLSGARLQHQQIPYSEQAARDCRVELFPDATHQPGWETSVARRLGAREVLDAPLLLGLDEVGDFTLYKTVGRHFTEADRDFLQKVSASVSLALQNARRYENERRVADTLQEALLQLPTEVPGTAFAHAYHSAAEAAAVGGDFYDIFEMGADQVGIIIGDVAGKGLEAAALTSLVKNTIRAHAVEKGAVPARILALTNNIVYAATSAESFVTVFFGVLDRRRDRLVYASAGHTAGALVAKDGEFQELPYTGPLLGAFKDVVYEERTLSVAVDTSLFLYTDGLIEARREGELYGEERVFKLLRTLKGADPGGLVRAAVDDVMQFTGGHLDDDLALFAVCRTEGAGGAPAPERVEV